MVIVMCTSLLIVSCLGLYQSNLGLELSDVLPEGTAPAAFLRAREKYFSFYPMFAVLKGNKINFPAQQEQIEQYRLDIGIKNSSNYLLIFCKFRKRVKDLISFHFRFSTNSSIWHKILFSSN